MTLTLKDRDLTKDIVFVSGMTVLQLKNEIIKFVQYDVDEDEIVPFFNGVKLDNNSKPLTDYNVTSNSVITFSAYPECVDIVVSFRAARNQSHLIQTNTDDGWAWAVLPNNYGDGGPILRTPGYPNQDNIIQCTFIAKMGCYYRHIFVEPLITEGVVAWSLLNQNTNIVVGVLSFGMGVDCNSFDLGDNSYKSFIEKDAVICSKGEAAIIEVNVPARTLSKIVNGVKYTIPNICAPPYRVVVMGWDNPAFIASFFRKTRHAIRCAQVVQINESFKLGDNFEH